MVKFSVTFTLSFLACVFIMIDCYVLSPVRSAVLASRFPDAFLATREPSFAPFDPTEVLGLPVESTFDEICTYLALNDFSEYSFVWRSTTASDPLQATLAFNSDGSLVFGLSLISPKLISPKILSDASIEKCVMPWVARLREFASNPPTTFGSDFPTPSTIWGEGIAPPNRSGFTKS